MLGDRQKMRLKFRCEETKKTWMGRGTVRHSARFLVMQEAPNETFTAIAGGELVLTNLSQPHFVEGQHYYLWIERVPRPPSAHEAEEQNSRESAA